MSGLADDIVEQTNLASARAIGIPSADYERMLVFARAVYRLKDNPAYLDRLAADLPETARIETTWPSVLMGFDFHLTPEGPKLIEINNNAGGLYIGQGHWLPQADVPDLDGTLEQRLVAMFPESWQNIAIVDEAIEQQYMYPEMNAYAELLRATGRHVFLVSPQAIELRDDGLYCKGERLHAIYNRHTDFYLESGALADIRTAYERGQIVLNPHPRSYALIGDKTRMVDWWKPGLLEACVDDGTVAMIRSVTPETRRLADLDAEQAWQGRKSWVFKPTARHGGKGVVLGRAMSRKRFAALDVSDTIAQRLVPASEVEIDGQTMKLDIRLFMHGEDLIALAGRVWRGQVTNFREPGSGWVSLKLV
ncbi:MAG: hypothetical protein R8L58_07385 [Mariprofundaceae bacterium]